MGVKACEFFNTMRLEEKVAGSNKGNKLLVTYKGYSTGLMTAAEKVARKFAKSVNTSSL